MSEPEVTPPPKRRRDDAVTWSVLKGLAPFVGTVLIAAASVGMTLQSARGEVATLTSRVAAAELARAQTDERVRATEQRLNRIEGKLDTLLCIVDPQPQACLRARLAASPP